MSFVYVFSVILCLFLLRLVLNFFTPGLRSIPGPFLARFSNLWRLISTWNGHHELTLQKLHNELGPVVRIGPNVLSLSDPEVIESIYGYKTDFIKSDFTKVMQTIRNGKVLPTPGTCIDRAEHATCRKPFTRAFSMASPTKHEPFVDETICHMVRSLDLGFISGPSGVRRCEIEKWLQYFSFDAVGQMCFGHDFGFLDSGKDVEGLIASVVTTFKYFAIVGQMPWLDYILRKNPIMTHLLGASNPFALHAREMLQDRLVELKDPKNSKGRDDITSGLLEAKEAGLDQISDMMMITLIINILLVGSDSTSVALRPMIYYIARNRNIQARLQAELDAAAVTYPVTWKTIQSLPYLDAVIRETSRFHPAGSILLERVVPQTGLELPSGQKIPPGTVVGMVGWTVHRDRRVFGANADSFDPDRWLPGVDESTEDFRSRVQKMKQADLGFGHGTRSCVGRHIALLQIYKLVATLFGLFDIEPADPTKPWRVRSSFFSTPDQMDVVLRWRTGKGLHTLRDDAS